ncbi:FtsX-like permease family protein [Holdemania sp. 1001095H_141210_F2]|uniref:FtsX-like permease family protein n=1 Tax=Holdemania sp. 1001095H_141210_F2 TaxID=2787149 RepID=UPI00189E15B0|nr:ABC transporter permease [Holdemania sp. 1001095H_141210_F2]
MYNNNPQFSETRQVIYDQELQENTILVPGTTLAEICTAYANRTEIILSEHENSEPICWEEADQYNSEIILMLDSPEHLEPFIKEYSEAGDGIYTLESNNALYEKYGKPLNVIRYFALIILAVVVGNGILLIMILTALQIQDRKKEMGIFLSVGIPRYKIIIQFFVEMVLEMLIGACMAGIAALCIVKPLNDQLLTLTIVQKQTGFLDADKDISYSESEKYFSEVSSEKILDQFRVQLTEKEIVTCLICECGILLMSLCLISSKVLTMKPKKILT